MIRILLLFSVLFLSIQVGMLHKSSAQEPSKVIQGSVSMVDRIPDELFGTWKVFSVRVKTNNPEEFGESGVDIWNLSRSGNVITLMNPVSGARASVLVSDVSGNTVRFQKVSKDRDKESIETPVITVEDNNFYGIDKISVKKYKDGSLFQEDNVEYKVKAIKMSGANLTEVLGF